MEQETPSTTPNGSFTRTRDGSGEADSVVDVYHLADASNENFVTVDLDEESIQELIITAEPTGERVAWQQALKIYILELILSIYNNILLIFTDPGHTLNTIKNFVAMRLIAIARPFRWVFRLICLILLSIYWPFRPLLQELFVILQPGLDAIKSFLYEFWLFLLCFVYAAEVIADALKELVVDTWNIVKWIFKAIWYLINQFDLLLYNTPGFIWKATVAIYHWIKDALRYTKICYVLFLQEIGYFKIVDVKYFLGKESNYLTPTQQLQSEVNDFREIIVEWYEYTLPWYLVDKKLEFAYKFEWYTAFLSACLHQERPRPILTRIDLNYHRELTVLFKKRTELQKDNAEIRRYKIDAVTDGENRKDYRHRNQEGGKVLVKWAKEEALERRRTGYEYGISDAIRSRLHTVEERALVTQTEPDLPVFKDRKDMTKREREAEAEKPKRKSQLSMKRNSMLSKLGNLRNSGNGYYPVLAEEIAEEEAKAKADQEVLIAKRVSRAAEIAKAAAEAKGTADPDITATDPEVAVTAEDTEGTAAVEQEVKGGEKN